LVFACAIWAKNELAVYAKGSPAIFILIFGFFVSFTYPANAEIATLDEFKALGEKFDHLTTGFALTGEHEQLECGECHIGGVFEALPRECESCHDNVIATGMPLTHVETTAPCDTCHTTSGFVSAAVMDHSTVTGSCVSCHNGISATGKSADHVATTDLCEACHTTNFWQHLKVFDHEQVIGSCVTCHNNVVESGKPATHLPTTNVCDACHLYSMGPAWPTFTVDHAEVLGRCSFCHDCSVLPNSCKGPTHVVTSEECNACHTAGGVWADAQTQPQPQPTSLQHIKSMESCSSCHAKSGSARGKSAGHCVTNEECDACHAGTFDWGLTTRGCS
jgi:hypothetical protein